MSVLSQDPTNSFVRDRPRKTNAKARRIPPPGIRRSDDIYRTAVVGPPTDGQKRWRIDAVAPLAPFRENKDMSRPIVCSKFSYKIQFS